MAEKGEQRYYVMSRVNRVFAISSIIMFATFIWMFVDDYDREWKHFQREFRKLDISKTRDVLSSADLQNAVDAVAQVEADLEIRKMVSQEFAKTITELKAVSDKANQDYQFRKSEYEAAKYRYENQRGHGHEGQKQKAEMDKLFGEMEALRLKNEKAATDLESASAEMMKKQDAIRALNDSAAALARKAAVLQRKLANMDPENMSLLAKIGNAIRDMPLLDFLNPSYKIEQVVVPDVTDNLNFLRVPSVDRCQTCHQGLMRPEFAEDAQPFKTHPKLDLFLSSASPHPVEEFGCASCHLGRGRGTSFLMSIHRPSSHEQEEEWKAKYGWYLYHYWETPMLPTKYTEAGCLNCHSHATELRGAEKLNLGLQVIEKAGCYGCHNISRYLGRSKPGPSLRKIAAKTSKDWTYRWILNPKSFRHNTWMPRFFDQSNNSSDEQKARSRQEIHAMVAYLFQFSDTHAMASMAMPGDPARGEKILATTGCYGCHLQEDKTHFDKDRSAFIRTNTTSDMIRRMQGPELTGLATKTSADWVYNWIRNPHAFSPNTRMPDLRLTDQEAADVTAYLMQNRNEEFNTEIPPLDEKILNGIMLEFLAKNMTNAQAKETIEKSSQAQKLEFTGRKLIGTYGCFGCHEIPGFDTAMPIGTELTEEGSKPVSKLDFGYIHDIGHNNYDWFTQKLKEPRIFDRERVLAPLDKLRMPNFDLSDTEIDAVVTAIVGFVKPSVKAEKMFPRTPKNLVVEQGQRLVREYNCQGCHIIEGRGGSIRPVIREAVMKYEGVESDVFDAPWLTNVNPPNLISTGQKIRAEWLYDFIRDPAMARPRPWLNVRMPSFGFRDAELNTLVYYFAAVETPTMILSELRHPDPSSAEVAAGRQLVDDLGCATTCHIIGAKTPLSGSNTWAPDLALAGKRLRADWIVKWIRNPAAFYPGVRMPANLDGGTPDEEKQLQALRDYLVTAQ
ncbi:MAG: c-type cytochrome [Candidatus Hydrogenedentota bacterium]